MSGLRCWPGCLAVVTKSKAGNEGRTVVCVRLATRHELDEAWFEHEPTWVIDRPLRTLLGFRRPLVKDASLQPLLPPPGTDCTTHEADKPQPVEA